jgi:hypothetical protein
MKKLTILFVACFIVALAVSSCKGTQDCPAYSSVPTETVNGQA